MKKFCKSLWTALLDKLATIVIAAIFAGAVGVCNHLKIADTNRWVGEHLQDKQQQIDKLKIERKLK
jgi:hypothetical protein